MSFEYDQNKSVANEAKHGINFEQAQEIWSDLGLLEIEGKSKDEVRGMAIGKIGDKFWTAVWTRRGEDNEIIRIISVRRSRKKEKKDYEENYNSGRI